MGSKEDSMGGSGEWLVARKAEAVASGKKAEADPSLRSG
jgi:hypothetical protein